VVLGKGFRIELRGMVVADYPWASLENNSGKIF